MLYFLYFLSVFFSFPKIYVVCDNDFFFPKQFLSIFKSTLHVSPCPPSPALLWKQVWGIILVALKGPEFLIQTSLITSIWLTAIDSQKLKINSSLLFIVYNTKIWSPHTWPPSPTAPTHNTSACVLYWSFRIFTSLSQPYSLLSGWGRLSISGFSLSFMSQNMCWLPTKINHRRYLYWFMFFIVLII